MTVFGGNRKLLEDVLDGLFHIAKADDEIGPQEEQFLAEVAKRFGFSTSEFNSIKARHISAAKRNPYDVLGLKPSVSDEELERHYRKRLRTMMRNNSLRAACRRNLPSSPLRSAPLSATLMTRS